MSGERCVPPSLMPAKSKAQQRLMGLAYGNPEVRKQLGIKKKDARKLASTKHAGLPEKVAEECLHELFELFDQMNVVPKPQLQMDEPSGMGTPQEGNYDHPVIQQRKQVDSGIKQGMTPEEAHENAYGEIDTADTDSKAKLSATLGRIQHNSEKKGVYVEKGSTSLLARDVKYQQEVDGVTPDDLRTPQDKEVPDSEQQLDKQEEYDYNLDVAYLQKYGRA